MLRSLVAALLAAGWIAGAALADSPRVYRFEPGGGVRGMRSADLDGDGRLDLVVLLMRPTDEATLRPELLVLRAPETPSPDTFYGEADVTRIALDEGELGRAGAVMLGRFGDEGEWRIRFLSREGLLDVNAAGVVLEREGRHRVPTLFGRSPGREIVFWDAVGDLDGDGVDECWFPLGEGPGAMRVHGGRPDGDRTLDIGASSRGASDVRHLIRRQAYVPNLLSADLDGDGRRELVAYRKEGALWVWSTGAGSPAAPVTPAHRIPLPFLRPDLGPDEIHTPRFQLADVDGDGTTDLLVTIVTGNRRQLGSFRTRLLHFPGPFRDPKTGKLVPPRSRIDTESVALHPRFEDLDGDGALDYVSDAIRGTKADMVKRVLGQDPTIWYVGFRFDREAGTFHKAPYFSVERPYRREEAVSNNFARTGFFEGDFDGDGHRDLLDLGSLHGWDLSRAELSTLPRVVYRGGEITGGLESDLVPDAVVGDLDGDGRSDAVLWTRASRIYLRVSGGRR